MLSVLYARLFHAFLQGAPIKNNPLEKKFCILAMEILISAKLSDFVCELSMMLFSFGMCIW